MTLQEIALKPVLVLSQKASIQEAARAVCEKSVGSALVSDDHGHIVGIVTDRDLSCGALTKGLRATDPLYKVMSTSLIFVSENASLSEAVELMKDFGIRRLPVIRTLERGKQKCVGLLTMDDLILSKAVEMEDLAEIVSNQVLPLFAFEVKRFRSKSKQTPEFEQKEGTI